MKTLFELEGAFSTTSITDLDITVRDKSGALTNPSEITATLYVKDSIGTGYTPTSYKDLSPTNDTTGHFYVDIGLYSIVLSIGEYKIEWSIKLDSTHNLTAHHAFFSVVKV
jgi:hypothetical protein